MEKEILAVHKSSVCRPYPILDGFDMNILWRIQSVLKFERRQITQYKSEALVRANAKGGTVLLWANLLKKVLGFRFED